MINRKAIRRNNVQIATQSERNFDIIRTDHRPILVRQLEQDLESQQINFQQDLKPTPMKNFEQRIKNRPPSRAAMSHLQARDSNLNTNNIGTKSETQAAPDALCIALRNTTKHGVHLPESILCDRRQLYRFCSDFCYLWTLDELREYCSVAGLLACGTKTELLRRTYLALHHAERECGEAKEGYF